MGTKLKEILVKKEIRIPDLKGRVLVVDSYNVLYQFLTTIRTADGSALMDSKGRVTSHLNGLFNRTANLMQQGLRLAFVFDGKAPDLKSRERERRAELKEEARREYEIAKQRKDLELMKKYAARTSTLSSEMVGEAKKLVKAMGLPVIQAPSEGEAQAARIVCNGDAYAEISQDFDCLVFGVPRLVRNLTVTERRKLPGKLSHAPARPEIIDLNENLTSLGVTQDQMIALSMLVGTDYNYGGIRGIGPKKALKLVLDKGHDFEALFSEAGWSSSFDFEWKAVFDTIKNMPVTNNYTLEWGQPDREGLKMLLVDEHDFSEKRIEDTLKKIDTEKKKQGQKGLGDFMA